MAAAATLIMWFQLRSPELAEEFERLMASDRDTSSVIRWRRKSPEVAAGGFGTGQVNLLLRLGWRRGRSYDRMLDS